MTTERILKRERDDSEFFDIHESEPDQKIRIRDDIYINRIIESILEILTSDASNICNIEWENEDNYLSYKLVPVTNPLTGDSNVRNNKVVNKLISLVNGRYRVSAIYTLKSQGKLVNPTPFPFGAPVIRQQMVYRNESPGSGLQLKFIKL